MSRTVLLFRIPNFFKVVDEHENQNLISGLSVTLHLFIRTALAFSYAASVESYCASEHLRDKESALAEVSW